MRAQRGDRDLGVHGGREQAEDLPAAGPDHGGADQDPARGVGDQLDQPLLLRDPAAGAEARSVADLDGVEPARGPCASLSPTEADLGRR